MARSPLFNRGSPGGLYHADLGALTFGNIWYVNSGHAAASTGTAFGASPDYPWSTVVAASDSGLLASGDIVLVAAGHTETLSAAAAWDCDTAGVTFRGQGRGDLRPTITLDTDVLADIDIDAANICFDNLRFVANFLDIAAAIDVNADGFTCKNCEFVDTSASLNAKIWILGAAAGASDRMIVEGCEFYAFGTANTAAISLPGTPDRCVIRDNILVGDWGTAAILAAGICTNLSILRNVISNLDAGDDKGINIVDTSTGIIAYNGVGARETDNTTDNITGGTKMVLIQNYSVDEGDRSGVLDPVATT